jgi:hypothetical protein
MPFSFLDDCANGGLLAFKAHSKLMQLILLLLLCAAESKADGTVQVSPSATEAGATIVLIFPQQAVITSVKIGGVAATVLTPPGVPATQIQVQIPKDAQMGNLPISVETGSGVYSGTVLIYPTLNNVEAAGEGLPGVPIGGTLKLTTSGVFPPNSLPPTIRLTLLPTRQHAGQSRPTTDKVTIVDSSRIQLKENVILANLPPSIDPGVYQVEMIPPIANATFGPAAIICVYNIGLCILVALVPIAVTGLLVFVLVSIPSAKKAPTGRPYQWYQLLFLEEENNTYSLSRAQFIIWLVSIASAYVFLFVARGAIQRTWEFPPLSGFAYTFLLSLGTLVVAQGTNSIKGVKGAGTVEPKLSDLVLNGDVLALERVQQILWTIIAASMFLWITFTDYVSANALPTIPQEMLVLMGISSGGYLAGKFARKPGPVIQRVDPRAAEDPAAVTFRIIGQKLSQNVLVWIDDEQVLKASIVTIDPDKDSPTEFATTLGIAWQPATGDWFHGGHRIALVNPDSQRAEWLVS